jgi:predicted acyl esterase
VKALRGHIQGWFDLGRDNADSNKHNPPPGYKAPIVCDGIVEMRDVMVSMRDGKHLCVDIYRPNIDGKFPALLAIAPHNKEYQTPEFAEAVQWAQTGLVPHVVRRRRGRRYRL